MKTGRRDFAGLGLFPSRLQSSLHESAPPRPFAADFGKIVLKALTIRGIYGRQMYDTWYKMLAMLDSGLDVTGMITDRFPAKDYQAAFDLMLTGEAGKVILDWTDV